MQNSAVVKVGLVAELEKRCPHEGSAFWVDERHFAVLDAEKSQRLDAENFADLTMLDGFADALQSRKSTAVSWHRLREGWAMQMRQLTSTTGIRQLAQRMDQILQEEVGREQDLTWLAERLATESLVPAIIGGLSPMAHRCVVTEVHTKLRYVLSDVDVIDHEFRHQAKMICFQLAAGLVIRRELKGRAAGRRPRQVDLTDPLVDMLPDLGIGRAVDAVASLLTAITGSPGTATACLLYELQRQHAWRARLEEELAAVPVDELYQSPMRAAPLTGRFVKEALRMWSSPPVVSRPVRKPMDHDGLSLKEGQIYLLSPFFLHRNKDSWPDADVFDPDRWLPDHPRSPCPHAAFVPFGWAPKSCVGASLGLAQLVVVAHLFCTRFNFTLAKPDEVKMALASVCRPVGFYGTVGQRQP